MIKIITKKIKMERLEKEASKLILCTAPKKSDHCLNQCFCGVPHERDYGYGNDMCHRKKEICFASNSGIIKVTCKPLSKKERIAWVEKEMKNES